MPVIVSLAVVVTAYWLYALLAVPWIEPEATGRVARTDGMADSNGPGEGWLLAEHFAPGDWELDQPKILESRQARLLFLDYSRRSECEVELHPCTLIFTPEEKGASLEELNRRAVVLEAPEGAVLEFDEPLDLNRAKIGRLVSGQLMGKVVIRGKGKSPGPEDDLLITTQNVHLSERQITAPEAVAFQWGVNRGRGRDLTIELSRAEQGRKYGPNVSGVKTVQVRHVDQLQLQVPKEDAAPAGAPAPRGPPPKKAAKETVWAEVTCRGPFKFDLENRVATFSDHVDVWQIHPTGPADHLSCELLSVFFAPSKSARQEKDESNPADLVPQRIEATGKPVVVHAPSRKVQAFGQRLEYGLESGRIVLDGGEEVFLKQLGSEIHARDVQYQPAGPGEMGQVVAHGPGRLVGQSADRPDERLHARWREKLQVRPHGPNQVISLTGGAEVDYHGIGRLSAGEIHFWLLESRSSGAPSAAAQWKPDRMMARHDVRLAHPQVDAAVNRMEVWFECVGPPPGAGPIRAGPMAAALMARPGRTLAWITRIFVPGSWDVRTTTSGATRLVRLAMAPSDRDDPGPPLDRRLPAPDRAAPRGRRGADAYPLPGLRPGARAAPAPADPLPGLNPAGPGQRFDVTGDLLRAQIVLRGREAELAELVLEGDVRLKEAQTERPDERPMLVIGDRVHVVDASRPHAAVAVTGRTAHFEARGLGLNGSNINLNRGTNRLWIDGPGWMTLPMDRDPRGRPLADAGPLEVHWQARMDFDGRTVRFDESVVATSRHYHLRTETLEVGFSEPVRFSETRQDARPEIQTLACRAGAFMENRSFDEQGQVSLDRVEVANLDVDVISGDMTADGPGWFRSVRRDGGAGLEGRLPGIADKDNGDEDNGDGKDSEAGLVHLGIDFQRTLTGNLHRREMAFEDRVRTVYGPVDSFSATLPFDRPDALGPRGGVLTCDRLAVTEMAVPHTRRRALEMLATGNARVEAATYDAWASRISYAESKGLVILEGDGRSDAELFCQERIGAERQHFAARRIYYWPETNHWTIDNGSILEVSRPISRDKRARPPTPPGISPR